MKKLTFIFKLGLVSENNQSYNSWSLPQGCDSHVMWCLTQIHVIHLCKQQQSSGILTNGTEHEERVYSRLIEWHKSVCHQRRRGTLSTQASSRTCARTRRYLTPVERCYLHCPWRVAATVVFDTKGNVVLFVQIPMVQPPLKTATSPTWDLPTARNFHKRWEDDLKSVSWVESSLPSTSVEKPATLKRSDLEVRNIGLPVELRMLWVQHHVGVHLTPGHLHWLKNPRRIVNLTDRSRVACFFKRTQ